MLHFCLAHLTLNFRIFMISVSLEPWFFWEVVVKEERFSQAVPRGCKNVVLWPRHSLGHTTPVSGRTRASHMHVRCLNPCITTPAPPWLILDLC